MADITYVESERLVLYVSNVGFFSGSSKKKPFTFTRDVSEAKRFRTRGELKHFQVALAALHGSVMVRRVAISVELVQ
jgi:hypothetical protein